MPGLCEVVGTVARREKRRRSANRRWRPHVHREKVDGVLQVAVRKPTEILHEHSVGAEERANAKTRNVDKMTAK